MFEVADKGRRKTFRMVHKANEGGGLNADLRGIEEFQLSPPSIARRAARPRMMQTVVNGRCGQAPLIRLNDGLHHRKEAIDTLPGERRNENDWAISQRAQTLTDGCFTRCEGGLRPRTTE